MREKVLWFITGGAVPWLLAGGGIFFLIFLRGGPFRSPRKLFGALSGEKKKEGISPFRAVTAALAGTLGVGNIVGVADAIRVGGAGAVFWMWVSAFAAMILKYAEILLAVRHRRTSGGGRYFGGACYYIRDLSEEKGKKKTGKTLAGIFALLTAVDALTMGCMIQVNAISGAASGVAGISPWVVGITVALFVLPMIFRGSTGISALTEYLVPIMSAGYAILSAAVLIVCRERVPDVLAGIFREAFDFQSIGGGVIGFLTCRALRVGCMRGLLSNEGGCGTAPTAHAAANTDFPAKQGVWGIFEVFADTVVLCTATALVILLSPGAGAEETPVMMTLHAYSSVLGEWSEWFFLAAIFCFGYATVLCWSDYGARAIGFLSSRPIVRLIYPVVFCGLILVGAAAAPAPVWTAADIAIAAMTAINLFALILGRKEIADETERWLSS